MARFWAPRSAKIRPGAHPKRHPNLDRFLARFWFDSGALLAANFAPTWRPKTAPERPKGRPGGILEASWTQKPPRTRPDPLQSPIWYPPGLDFGPFFDAFSHWFGMNFGPLLVPYRFHLSPRKPAVIACSMSNNFKIHYSKAPFPKR